MVTNLGEYENGYRQLLDIYEAQNPGVTINLSSFNEDTEAAFLTKVAGGYLPAIEKIPENSGRTVGRGNYQEYVNLSEIDFPWFDRWTYDVKNTWADRYGLPGPRTLDVFQGIVASMVYHRDIMEKAGWDPQKDVKTLDDFERLLDDLVKFVEAEPDMDFPWDPWFRSPSRTGSGTGSGTPGWATPSSTPKTRPIATHSSLTRRRSKEAGTATAGGTGRGKRTWRPPSSPRRRLW
jgi:ABC-type glycerol-3-phosphate transport system substrate-binding protein